ncbi:unnamed protein product [Dovyalis caffra]|uniref:Uncharacterized protein n=1 Tax=Dovyalis caffra TaxID=77055 RepID=A0AAV1QPP2_9ROSI|nr:unnamed protein product [Dovyalis caffra]
MQVMRGCRTMKISTFDIVVGDVIPLGMGDQPDDPSQLHSEVGSFSCEGIAQNTTGNVFVRKDGGDVEISGSPTEKAILFGSQGTALNHIPLPILTGDETDPKVHIYWNGAAEMVLDSCTRYLNSNGSLQSIDKDMDFFKAAIGDMAACSLHCVVIAYRPDESDKVPTDEESSDKWVLPEDLLPFSFGLCGSLPLFIIDKSTIIRPSDATRTVLSQSNWNVDGYPKRSLHILALEVPMVTGDNIQTAKAIALEFGILSSDADTKELIIEGKVFRAYSQKEREIIAKKITVMGRSSPNDKLLLVQALRCGGEVVAVTGDGTNDASALHELALLSNLILLLGSCRNLGNELPRFDAPRACQIIDTYR